MMLHIEHHNLKCFVMVIPSDPYFENKKSDQKNQKDKLDPHLASLLYKLNSSRPPSEIILNDNEVQTYLNISKRKLDYLREQRLIGYAQPIPRGMIHYTYQDILDYCASGRKPAIKSQRKF